MEWLIRILASVLVLALFVCGVGFYGKTPHALFPSFGLLQDTHWDFSLFWFLGADKLRAFFLLVLMGLGFLGWSCFFQNLLFPRSNNRSTQWMGFFISVCLFSLYVFGLGINEILYGPLVFLFFLPAIGKGWSVWKALHFSREETPKKRGYWLLAFPLALWLSEYFSAPIIWDAVLDHFHYAKEVARLHQIPFHWTNHTGDIPKAAELILAGFWSMGGESLSRLSSALAAVGAAGLICLFSKAWSAEGTIGNWIFWTCPFFLALFSWGYVEGFLVLFEGAALYSLWIALEQPRNKVWPALTAFFLGFAFTVKYTAALAIVGTVFLWLYGRLIRKVKLKVAWPLLAFFTLPLFPWLFKNWLAFHNPFYPLASSIFGTRFGYGPGAEKDLWQDTGLPQGLGLGGRLDLIWKVFFTQDNAVAAAWTPLVFMSLPWAWKALRSQLGTFLLLFIGVFFLGWLSFCTNLRHASGGTFALVLLAAMAWETAFQGKKAGPQILFGVGAACGLWFCLLAQLNSTAPYASALGVEDNLLRLKRHYSLSLDTYAAYRDIEENSGPRDKVVAFGVFQTYPLQRTTFVDFAWKNPIFLEWASTCHTADQLARLLKREGVVFFLYQKAEAEDMYFRSRKFELAEMAPVEYKKFWKLYMTPLWIYDNSIVYRLNDHPIGTNSSPLLELPGIQEKDFGAMDKDLFHQQAVEGYKIITGWVEHNPDVAEGWARRSILESSLGLCGQATRSGERAWGKGMRSTDLCRSMAACFGKLKKPLEEKRWSALALQRQNLMDRACALALGYDRSIP